jgi:hypothetical protein
MFVDISWYCGNEIASFITGAVFVNKWRACWSLNNNFAAYNKLVSE